jgi:hypothetical protein
MTCTWAYGDPTHMMYAPASRCVIGKPMILASNGQMIIQCGPTVIAEAGYMRCAHNLGCLPLEVEDEEGNVVLLHAGGVVAGKTSDVLEKGVCEKSRRNIALRFQKLFAA